MTPHINAENESTPENILKCMHLFISRVRIEIILLYDELSDVVGQMRYLIHPGCAVVN